MEASIVDEILKELGEKTHIKKVEVETILSILRKIGAFPSAGKKQQEFVLQDDEEGITHMSFEEYLYLPQEERDALSLELQDRNWNIIQSELERRNAQWIIVCDGKVFCQSQEWDDFPTDEEIEQIGKTFGKAPLLFAKSALIEESSWTRLSGNDWYPTIPVCFGGVDWDNAQMNSSGLSVAGDFDTGSPLILLDMDTLMERGITIVTPFRPALRDIHLGRNYMYRIFRLRVSIVDDSGTIHSALIDCRCIPDFRDSPLCKVNPNRQALIGRNILLRLSLRVELDGASCTTRLPSLCTQ
jgi:hypothetical protein